VWNCESPYSAGTGWETETVALRLLDGSFHSNADIRSCTPTQLDNPRQLGSNSQLLAGKYSEQL